MKMNSAALLTKFGSDSEPEEEDKYNYNCRICGALELRNGEFETIKLGDIFTHVSQFKGGHEPVGDPKEKLCGRCVSLKKENKLNSTLLAEPESDVEEPSSQLSEERIASNNNEAEDLKPRITELYHEEVKEERMEIEEGVNLEHPQHFGISNDTLLKLLPNHSQLDSNFLIYQTVSESGEPIYISSPATTATDTLNNNNKELNLNLIVDPSFQTISTASLGPAPASLRPPSSNEPISLPTESLNIKIHPISTSNAPTPPPPAPQLPRAPKPKPIVSDISSIEDSIACVADPSNDITLPQRPPKPLLNRKRSSTSSNSNNNSLGGGGGIIIKREGSGGGFDPTSKDCPICNRTFKTHKIAQTHYQKVHEKPENYCCEFCGACFSYSGSLESHIAASHSEDQRPFPCTTCGLKFKEKSNLTAHSKIHTDNPKKHQCDYCPSAFSKRVNLRYHIKRKHPDQAPDNNNSGGEMMPTNFSSIPNSTNLSSPSNQPLVPGPGVSFTTPTNTTTNKDRAQGQFKCEQCGKPFLFKNNLKAHQRTHTREKKFVCDLCNKSFIYKESLKNHMLLHSNELPYECDICNKKFRDRSNRRKHVKNVHKYMFLNGESTTALPTPANLSEGDIRPTTTELNPVKKSKKKKKVKKEPVEGSNVPQDGLGSSESKVLGAGSIPNSNNASVIVSTHSSNLLSTLNPTDLDRKIIMSPSQRSPPEFGGEYVQRNDVIVKASVSPTYYAQQQPPPMQQNVIVYPKGVIKQEYSSNSVISSSQSSISQQYYSTNQGRGAGDVNDSSSAGVYIPLTVSNPNAPNSTYEYQTSDGIQQIIHRVMDPVSGQENIQYMQVIESSQELSGINYGQYWAEGGGEAGPVVYSIANSNAIPTTSATPGEPSGYGGGGASGEQIPASAANFYKDLNQFDFSFLGEN